MKQAAWKIRKPLRVLAIIIGCMGCLGALAALCNVICGSRDMMAVFIFVASLICPVELLLIGTRGRGLAFGAHGRWSICAICVMPLLMNRGVRYPSLWFIPLLGIVLLVASYGIVIKRDLVDKNSTDRDSPAPGGTD